MNLTKISDFSCTFRYNSHGMFDRPCVNMSFKGITISECLKLIRDAILKHTYYDYFNSPSQTDLGYNVFLQINSDKEVASYEVVVLYVVDSGRFLFRSISIQEMNYPN